MNTFLSRRPSVRSALVVVALLSLGACGDDASSAVSPATDPATGAGESAGVATASTPAVEATPASATEGPTAIAVARKVVRRINAERPKAARRHATPAAVRRMVDLHDQGFDFVRPPRCRVSGDSRLCRSDLVVPSGGGTSSNLRVRLIDGQWTVTKVEGLD